MQISNSASLGLTMSSTSLEIEDDKPYLLKPDNSSNLKQKNEDILYSIKFRAMILFQVFASGSYSVLVHLCEKDGLIAFSSTTMNFILEVVKLSFSFSALFYSTSIKNNICPNKRQII